MNINLNYNKLILTKKYQNNHNNITSSEKLFITYFLSYIDISANLSKASPTSLNFFSDSSFEK